MNNKEQGKLFDYYAVEELRNTYFFMDWKNNTVNPLYPALSEIIKPNVKMTPQEHKENGNIDDKYITGASKMTPQEHKENGDFDDASVAEHASTEAEQANRTIDAREEKSKDRLNINRPPPQTTSWERENKIMEEQKTKVVALANDEKQPEKKQEQPKQEPKFPFNDAEPIFAYYGNDKKSLLFFILRHPDGPQGQPGPTDTHQIHNTKEHQDAWYWVHKFVGQEAINRNTKKEIDRLDKMRKKDEVADKDRMHKMDQEKLFQAKIDAFEMDVIRNTSNRDMKSKIRRSKSIMELTAYVGAIIALENMNGKPATD